MVLNNSLLFVLACAVSFAAAASFNNTVYIISNAETPSLHLPGLTPVGFERSRNCLPALLAPLNIGLIATCAFDKDSGLCPETIETITPTAQTLGLNITTTCGAGEEADDDCLHDLIRKFGKTSTQSILIVWDILDLDSLFENLDIDDSTEDDNDDDDDDDDTPQTRLPASPLKDALDSMGKHPGHSGVLSSLPDAIPKETKGSEEFLLASLEDKSKMT
ncbi:hypothetical protein JR316_0013350 [Psilocybe cubensis]|uniref:Uncharacterized protein n=2 Tax=Psilocybe cubensis TaxID=181762 RepID=A0ACB8GHI6_PSICU|nr:hypothetical protein JR316_0013350 [Psilocybe cubensis]KAH9474882.1 hypothetical protein JR316_0013350 [Psilocybe cubensis]